MAIGDYAIVLDTALAMSANDHAVRDFAFNFSSDFTRGRGCVLTWRAHIARGENLRYDIALNGETIWRTPSGLFDGEQLTVLHEVVSGNQFRAGNHNQDLRFRVRGGQGTLVISDIVIHYGRDR